MSHFVMLDFFRFDKISLPTLAAISAIIVSEESLCFRNNCYERCVMKVTINGIRHMPALAIVYEFDN